MNHTRYWFLFSILLSFSTILPAQPKPGQLAPDIALPGVAGSIQKLSDQKGKIVLVDFWASWCGPCRKANPNLVRLYAKYKKEGFQIFSVSIDENKTDWKKAIARDNMTWTHVNENGGWDGPVANVWKIEQIPVSYLLDRSGKIMATDLGGTELEMKIVELLKQ